MRILLAEDNDELALWLSRALQSRGFAVDHIADGRAVDQALATVPYALAILDLGLPRMDGLEVLRRLRARGGATPVLVLTARGEVADRVRGLDLGADDYLAKPFELDELEARVKALLRRSSGHERPLVSVGSLAFDTVGRVFTLAGRTLALTPREAAVLEVLVLTAGRAVRKQQLFEQVFVLDDDVGLDAIEIYVHRLRRKLEGSDVAITTLRGLGYLLERRGEPS